MTISLADRLPPSPLALHRASRPAKVHNTIKKIVKYITRNGAAGRSPCDTLETIETIEERDYYS